MSLTAPKPLPKDYPTNPKTLGDHLKKRRLDLRLSQEEAATRLQVDQASVHRWETGRNTPTVPQLPRIFAFLGYDPYPRPRSLPEKLKSYRRARGLLQRELAAKLGVPRGTLAGWERGVARPSRGTRERVLALLAG